MLYHVWFDRVSGGVDVFLFISAFLLVGTFLRKADAGRAMRPPAYWARTFKRLLPPTAVVALATLAGVYLVLPADRWMTALTDAIGSVLHVENWVLVRRGVDYYAAEETGASAFQHFWSLSIQGQVFLAWPLLIAGGVLLARWRGWSVRGVLAVVFALVLVASFAWSVHSTAVQQEIAYFDTFARLWEFAAGSLLGLALPVWEERRARTGRRRRPRPRAALVPVVMGWAGIVGLVSCGLLVDVQGAFPGWIAAWPLAAAALVLCAGTTGHPLGVDRLLSTRPGRVLGDISYGLYLVHWPLLTLYLARAGKERAGLLDGLVLILLSLVLAWLLTKVVDTPVRRWRWAGAKARRGGLVVLTCLVLALAPMIGAQQHLLGEQREAEARAVADNPGARVLDPDFTVHPDADPSAEPLPTAATLGKDWFTGTEPCTGALEPQGEAAERLSTRCAQIPGEEGGPVLVSAGNSRVEQFTGALAPLAAREGWTVITLWEGGCTYAPDAEVNEVCDRFSADTEAYIEQIAPEAVVLNTTFLSTDYEETMVPGIEQTLASLGAQGSTVMALRGPAAAGGRAGALHGGEGHGGPLLHLSPAGPAGRGAPRRGTARAGAGPRRAAGRQRPDLPGRRVPAGDRERARLARRRPHHRDLRDLDAGRGRCAPAGGRLPLVTGADDGRGLSLGGRAPRPRPSRRAPARSPRAPRRARVARP
ncbi:acyltransferase family protein [Brachybacterium paraconglomeratum]|uniref:acyltransferase family protein n=1 Tax=Brachybacterium paraconglomeratum TaxID=173362 RepID=UPI00387A44EC